MICKTEDKTITVSFSLLSESSGKSRRTLGRAVQELSRKGYLTIGKKFVSGSLWPVNRYTCTMPVGIYNKLIDQSIDSGNSGNLDKYSNWITPKDSIDDHMSANSEYLEMMECRMDRHQDDICRKNEEKSTYQQDESFVFSKNDPHKDNYQVKRSTQCSASQRCEIFHHKSTPLRLRLEPEIARCITIIHSLRELKVEKENLFFSFSSDIGDSVKKFDLMQDANRISSELMQYEQNLEYMEKMITLDEKKRSVIDSVISDETVAMNMPGGKNISKGLLWWIKKKLFSFGIKKDFMAKIVNEIVYCVRFGSLSRDKYQITEKPLMHSINIALKLVRDGKWQSPASFKNGEALV